MMPTASDRAARTRQPLNRERVLRAAVVLADEQGIESLSMRKLGSSVGVEAMSLYNHVSNKDDLLDGIAELVAAELLLPEHAPDWRALLRGHAISSHAMLLRHPWAAGLAESRSQSGPVRLGLVETILSGLRREGFSVAGAYRALQTVDSYTYGYTLQEVSWPITTDQIPEAAASFVERTPAGAYPHVVEVATLVADPEFDHSSEFEDGLELVLTGLEGLRDAG